MLPQLYVYLSAACNIEDIGMPTIFLYELLYSDRRRLNFLSQL
jgi:hypothetical protein